MTKKVECQYCGSKDIKIIIRQERYGYLKETKDFPIVIINPEDEREDISSEVFCGDCGMKIKNVHWED